jgi:C4-dicarboxylate transporter DctM subunit
VEPLTIGIIGCAVFLILLLVGVPVAFVMLAVGFLGSVAVTGWEAAVGMITTTPFYTAGQYALTPLPLFVFMASLTFATGLGTSMYSVATKWLSKLSGGLGIATTVASTVFGTLTGSSLVTAAMFTKVSVPEMRKYGYDSSFAHGLTCASGVIGMLIPPSMLAIIYGLLSGESIGKLFMAGVGPGLLTCLGFSLLIFGMVKRNPKLAPLSEETFTWREKFASMRGLWAIIIVAVIMLGGIFAGIFSVTEGGAIGAFSIFIIVVAMKKMNWGIMKWVCLDTARTSAMIFLLLIGATLFSRFITVTGITSQFVGLISESGMPAWGIMAGLMLMYIVLGCFLEPTSILCITLPLVLPLMDIYGWNSIYLAMLIIYNMHIGTLTPPVGMTLFAAKGAAEADVGIMDITRGIIPFILVEVLILIILVLCEPLTIGLARWM